MITMIVRLRMHTEYDLGAFDFVQLTHTVGRREKRSPRKKKQTEEVNRIWDNVARVLSLPPLYFIFEWF